MDGKAVASKLRVQDNLDRDIINTNMNDDTMINNNNDNNNNNYNDNDDSDRNMITITTATVTLD